MTDNQQILSVAGWDFVWWGNSPPWKIIFYTNTPGGDEVHIYLKHELWWHFSSPRIYQKRDKYLVNLNCWEPVASMHSAEDLARSGGWLDVIRAHHEQNFMPKGEWWQGVSKMTVSRECTTALECFEGSSMCAWWFLVKKRHKENPRRAWKQFCRWKATFLTWKTCERL